jgi:hypothetical protein
LSAVAVIALLSENRVRNFERTDYNVDWFSEKFIEDCIVENPSIFFGRSLRLIAQQPRLEGFIPDIIFENELGEKMIVEIQRSALDRYHLYKCLEYRDLLACREPHQKILVTLVCEIFPERYRNIVTTHDVDVCIFTREQIIDKAVQNCPLSLKAHLLKQSPGTSDTIETSRPKKLRRYAWREDDTLSDVYGFVSRELTRCDYWQKLRDENGGRDILWLAQSILDDRDSYSGLLDPADWRIDNLVSKPNSWVPPHLQNLTRIRKPVAEFWVFETSKQNISVRWLPKDSHGFDNDSHDWIEAPNTEPYAYQRPANELLFIRDIYRLSPDPERYASFEDGEERAALSSMFLALVWAMIRHIQKVLSMSIDLKVLTQFQIIPGEVVGSQNFSPRRDIVDWRVVTMEELKLDASRSLGRSAVA